MNNEQDNINLAADRAKNFFSNVEKVVGPEKITSYYYECPNLIQYSATQAACHSSLFSQVSLQNLKTAYVLASCFQVTDITKEDAEVYWEFCTDPKRSPFRVFSPEKFVPLYRKSDGLQSGFLIPSEVLRGYPELLGSSTTALKAMLVFFRAAMEFPGHIKLWRNMCEEGYDPYKALVTCSYFHIAGDIISWKPVYNSNHWIISPQTCDLEALSKGEIKKHRFMSAVFSLQDKDSYSQFYGSGGYYDTNGRWFVDDTRKDFKYLKNKAAEAGTEKKGRFGDYMSLELKDIDNFYSVIEECRENALK